MNVKMANVLMVFVFVIKAGRELRTGFCISCTKNVENSWIKRDLELFQVVKAFEQIDQCLYFSNSSWKTVSSLYNLTGWKEWTEFPNTYFHTYTIKILVLTLVELVDSFSVGTRPVNTTVGSLLNKIAKLSAKFQTVVEIACMVNVYLL